MPMHPDFKRILDNFIKQYGEEKGREYFYAWLRKHGLDDTKPYSVQAQLVECFGDLCESFNWLDEPLFSYVKSDKGGKYYRCVALTANISMNRNDYTDAEELSRVAGTLTWRPININHDHKRFLPFPDNRVDYAVFEDNRVECIIRIDNKQRDIQRMIENGDIMHPSIEGVPRSVEYTENGVKPCKWNFTALALLERDVTLPGDPLTYIEPLPLNESMSRSLVESLRVERESEENMSEKQYAHVAEAKWTTAYINNLPDSSFAYIEPGGKKDSEGKTVPRSLRHLPYRDENGRIDKPHLLNALARLPQTKLSAEAKAEARRKLCSAVRAWNKAHSDKIESSVCNTDVKEQLYGLETCGQCRYFTPTESETQTIAKDVNQPDSTVVTRVDKPLGPDVGVCEFATRLTGVNVYVRRTDPACTDGRPIETPAEAGRTIGEATMEELEKQALKADYEKRLAEKEQRLLEEVKKANKQREEAYKALSELAEKASQLTEKERRVAELTADNARLREELERQRSEVDSLRSEVVKLNVVLEERNKDVAYYKERLDTHAKHNEELTREVTALKERLASAISQRDEEAAKKAEAVQRAINAEAERSRIAEENALLLEKISKLQQEIYDASKIRAEASKSQIETYAKLRELTERNNELVETIRDLKRKLSKQPKRIKVKA